MDSVTGEGDRLLEEVRREATHVLRRCAVTVRTRQGVRLPGKVHQEGGERGVEGWSERGKGGSGGKGGGGAVMGRKQAGRKRVGRGSGGGGGGATQRGSENARR